MSTATNKKPIVYLAGPYRGDVEHNVHTAVTTARLIEHYHPVIVFLPHNSLVENLIEPKQDRFWLDRDLEFLKHCDALFRMAGLSPGADAEVSKARAWNIPVFYSHEELKRWCELGFPKEG